MKLFDSLSLHVLNFSSIKRTLLRENMEHKRKKDSMNPIMNSFQIKLFSHNNQEEADDKN